MEAVELIGLYERGARFACGCEERGLHASVQRALLEGRVPVSGLLKCPTHGQPLELLQQVVAAEG